MAANEEVRSFVRTGLTRGVSRADLKDHLSRCV